MPTLRVLRLIANSDPRLFEHHLRQAGLTIVGRRDRDPLRSTMQAESVLAIASTLSEDVDDTLVMTPYQRQLRDLAEQAGYEVGLIEGLDQMPGSWTNPIRNVLRAQGGLKGGEEEKDPAGGDQTAEGAPPPPDGGAPPPPGGEPPPPA